MFALTHLPGTAVPATPIPHADKAYHVVLFFVLAWLGGTCILRDRPRSSARTLVVWAVIYLAYAAMDECTQPTFGRTASLVDWVCDGIGIVLASAILLLTRRRQAANLRPGSSAR
ncbi:MAG: VanZ family protein [Phycisphaerae bacterium]|jgi:VanZ family protein